MTGSGGGNIIYWNNGELTNKISTFLTCLVFSTHSLILAFFDLILRFSVIAWEREIVRTHVVCPLWDAQSMPMAANQHITQTFKMHSLIPHWCTLHRWPLQLRTTWVLYTSTLCTLNAHHEHITKMISITLTVISPAHPWIFLSRWYTYSSPHHL